KTAYKYEFLNKAVQKILFFHCSTITVAFFLFPAAKPLRLLPLYGIFLSTHSGFATRRSQHNIKHDRVMEKAMCSIFGVLDIKTDAGELRKKALELSRLMRHRGPDW
ncbi:hypothetical protein JTM67_36940, partial [Pseudomonas aeruginosa]|nr:hypothetical protein [Pseudomonas aeruginosa]